MGPPTGSTVGRSHDESGKAAERRRQTKAAKLKPLHGWVARAKWPHNTANGAGGIVSAVANATLRAAVVSYTKKYFAEHGRWPTGEHPINEVVVSAYQPDVITHTSKQG